MLIVTEAKAKAMARTGLVELISDREYSLSQAKNRIAGKIPSCLTDGGEPMIIELDSTRTRQRAKKHLAAWFVKGGLR